MIDFHTHRHPDGTFQGLRARIWHGEVLSAEVNLWANAHSLCVPSANRMELEEFTSLEVVVTDGGGASRMAPSELAPTVTEFDRYWNPENIGVAVPYEEALALLQALDDALSPFYGRVLQACGPATVKTSVDPEGNHVTTTVTLPTGLKIHLHANALVECEPRESHPTLDHYRRVEVEVSEDLTPYMPFVERAELGLSGEGSRRGNLLTPEEVVTLLKRVAPERTLDEAMALY